MCHHKDPALKNPSNLDRMSESPAEPIIPVTPSICEHAKALLDHLLSQNDGVKKNKKTGGEKKKSQDAVPTQTPTNYFELTFNFLLTVPSPHEPHNLLSTVIDTIVSTPSLDALQGKLFECLGEGGFDAMLGLMGEATNIAEFARVNDLNSWIMADKGGGDISGSRRAAAEDDASRKKSQQEIDEAASLALIAEMQLQEEGYNLSSARSAASASASTSKSNNNNNNNNNNQPPAIVGVTVKRQSDKDMKKYNKRLQKQAAIALKNARDLTNPDSVYDFDEAVTNLPQHVLDEEQRLGVKGAGFRSATDEDIRAIREALNPSGTREYTEKKSLLPIGTIREYFEGYEQVTIPAKLRDEALEKSRIKLDSSTMDEVCLKGFIGISSLNPMQSATFHTAFHTHENLLICAPTGAGKTNVAMLATLAHFRDKGVIGDNFTDTLMSSFEGGKKVIYIAPMKALAQEVVEKFSQRLRPLNLVVKELTGDMQLTRAEAERADVIVTTPEKWDVTTRKGGDGSLGESCGLLIIDEVHLLADDRGAVIESIVARQHRYVETSQRNIRIVGLSATLPNYKDVARFLHVNEDSGLFHFGPEHRPVPLQQTFIGVTDGGQSRFQIANKMNTICYDQVVDSLRRGYQVMVFVHSRKDTGGTARALAEIASRYNTLESHFLTSDNCAENSAFSKFSPIVSKSRNREVQQHFRNGMGIHHAGMLRGDRKLTENMFAEGAIKVLCCTATLAWGINLPAHTVIIKGTEIYNPERGGLVDLSILDVQQIFGRAGRPQYDTSGEAVMITSQKGLARYLKLFVNSVPIESNFIKQLADHLNAEVVGGTVSNIQEAAIWLRYTYLYVRMLKNPIGYAIKHDERETDPQLVNETQRLIRDAAKLLDERRMIRYDPGSGNLAVTDLGRVASHFYIQNESVSTFNHMLERSPFPDDSTLLHVICSACEFENVKVRAEEIDEMDELKKKFCPLKLKADVSDSSGKCCVLLQSFISGGMIKSFTLISDTNYIASSAGRVSRALFEMCLRRGMAGAAIKLLRIAKSIDKQVWWFHSIMRQFHREFPDHVFKALEARGYGSYDMTLQLLEMDASEVGGLAKHQKSAKNLKKYVRFLPKIHISCVVQPLTRGILKFCIALTPDFDWNASVLGSATGMWLWVEDNINERIYHQEYVLLTRRNFPDEIELELMIPAFEPLPPQYFIRLVSDQFVGVEAILPVSFQHLMLPTRSAPFTDLMDLTPLPKAALGNKTYEGLYSFQTFNPIQTQLFHVLYHTDKNVLLGAPTGSGKTIVAELAILRLKQTTPKKKVVYIAPLKSLARERLNEWKKKLGGGLGWCVLELSGDTSVDSGRMNKADVLICTPEKWDLLSRGWMEEGRGKVVKDVGLLVIDEIHLLGEERGAVLEAIVSRTRYIDKDTRIIGLSTALANPRDLGEWLGITFEAGGSRGLGGGIGCYNFRPSVRPIPMEVHIQGFPGRHYCPRMATMNKPCYASIKEHSPTKPVIIFVASRRQTRLTALDLINLAAGDENPRLFLHDEVDAVVETIRDAALKHCLNFGIGLHHAGLDSNDRDTVEKLFLQGTIQVLVATATLAWGVNLPAHLVIVKGTEFFDGKTHRYVDYPVTDVLQMMGRAGRPQFDTKGLAVVLVQEGKKNFYKKFLYEPFPVESCLEARLCDCLNAEIAIGTIHSVEDCIKYMEWTYYWRRLKQNPSFYNCVGGNKEEFEVS